MWTDGAYLVLTRDRIDRLRREAAQDRLAREASAARTVRPLRSLFDRVSLLTRALLTRALPPRARFGRLGNENRRSLVRQPMEVSEMKWVTRKNAHVDRIACPWLIRRFVDREAQFLFVAADQVTAAAEREGAIPFDVKGVELGHVGGRCSFESILLKYHLTDPALERLAKIVHGADVAEDVGIAPEAAGLKAIAHGFALVHGENDHEKIRLETPLYDALYAWCQRGAQER